VKRELICRDDRPIPNRRIGEELYSNEGPFKSKWIDKIKYGTGILALLKVPLIFFQALIVPLKLLFVMKILAAGKAFILGMFLFKYLSSKKGHGGGHGGHLPFYGSAGGFNPSIVLPALPSINIDAASLLNHKYLTTTSTTTTSTTTTTTTTTPRPAADQGTKDDGNDDSSEEESDEDEDDDYDAELFRDSIITPITNE
jgi:hypothetical protein